MHSHSDIHVHDNSENKPKGKVLFYWEKILAAIAIIVITTLIIFSFNDNWIVNLLNTNSGSKYIIAKFIEELEPSEFIETEYQQEISIKLEDQGESKALLSKNDSNLFDSQGNLIFKKDDKLVILIFPESDQLIVYDIYRIPETLRVISLFFILAILLGGAVGFGSLVGLIASFIVLVGYLVPEILTGKPIIIPTLISGILLTFISIYLAHGFSKRSTIAFFTMNISIGLAILISSFLVNVTRLTGASTDESLILQLGEYGQINLQSVLLIGMIIGVIGVLDDVTTTQVSAVEQIYMANKKRSFQELFKSANAVGREHIASLVNTLILAYAGTSFPLFILLVSNKGEQLWVLLNSNLIIEEIIRALTGSITIMLAVPITSFFAAYIYQKKIKFNIFK